MHVCMDTWIREWVGAHILFYSTWTGALVDASIDVWVDVWIGSGAWQINTWLVDWLLRIVWLVDCGL